ARTSRPARASRSLTVTRPASQTALATVRRGTIRLHFRYWSSRTPPGSVLLGVGRGGGPLGRGLRRRSARVDVALLDLDEALLPQLGQVVADLVAVHLIPDDVLDLLPGELERENSAIVAVEQLQDDE